MSIQFSPVIAAQESGSGTPFSMKNIDLHKLGEHASPLVVLDDFRLRGRPFAPHPHAGFSAVTYVFEDSQAGLRGRTSLGNDLVIGPGGIVWTQAGSGVIVELRREISFSLQPAHNALVYVLTGEVLVSADGREQQVAGEHALALYGSGGRVRFEAEQPAHFLLLSGAEIREPVLAQGPFIMNERSQIEAAVARYRTGAMGHLAPLAES